MIGIARDSAGSRGGHYVDIVGVTGSIPVPPTISFPIGLKRCSPTALLALGTGLAVTWSRSGKFYGWRPIEFELLFEDGISEAREWLNRATTQDELDRICRKARTRRAHPSANRAA